ncbi:MAG TPA: hypothetical protein VFU02_22445 [Polyangiaceae bacterium]|nr:hypothetical protein [Polyangiaceae bacterium]
MSAGNKVWAELVQLVPVVTLAFPFIVHGTVDLSLAGTGFLVAAISSLPLSLLVLWAKQPLNPILVGTAVWLWLGALAFNVPMPALAAWLTSSQAFGLFVGAFVAGVAATLFSPLGFLACRGVSGKLARRYSFVLLGLCAACCLWSWSFRQDVRLGGGLPFIVLNVARRVLGRRASRFE